MRSLLNSTKLLMGLALLAFAGGCATGQQTENLLSAAGFKTVIASTPEQQEYLKTLKQGKLTAVKRHGKTYFVFPDTPHNQLYVGDQARYQKYQQLRLQKKLSNETLIAAEINHQENQWVQQMLAGWD